jgi:hypothetical protein
MYIGEPEPEQEIKVAEVLSVPGYLLLDCSVISVFLVISMLTLLLTSSAGLHFCVGISYVCICVFVNVYYCTECIRIYMYLYSYLYTYI